jgi:hypothetical protein
MRCVLMIFISLALMAVCPNDAMAVDNAERRTDQHPTVETGLCVEHLERSELDGSNASMGYTEFSEGLTWGLLFFDMDHRAYDWQDGKILGVDLSTDPWDSLTRVAPGLQYAKQMTEKWGFWAKMSAIAGFEDEILSGSWTYNPQLISFYVLKPQLKLYFGLGMLYNPVESETYPVLGAAWNANSKKGISGALGFPETMLRYGFNRKVALKFDFQWDVRTYRLAEDNAMTPKGYVQFENLIPGLKLEYAPAEKMMLRFGIRHHFGRKLSLFNHEEDELASEDVGASLAYLMSIDYSF